MSNQNNEIPNGFKKTEIGIIPEEWEVVRLGDIFKEVNKKERRVKIENNKDYKLILTRLYAKGIQLKEVKKGEKISAEYMYKIKEGDFVFSKINIRKGAFDFVPKELDESVVSTEHPILKLNRNLADQFFIRFYLSQPFVWEEFKKEAKGFSGKERVKVREFVLVKIPLPPLPEQKKIAHVLSTIQEAKEKTEAVIKAAKELKKSLMKHLFTYGPVPFNEAENVKLKETEIGLIPEDWEVVKLGDVIEKTEQKDPRKNPDWQFKYIDVSSINRDTLKIFTYKTYYGKNAPSRARKVVRKGDIIFATVRPTLKRLAMIGEYFDEQICSTAFCVLRAQQSRINNLYLFYALQRDVFISKLGEIQRGANYPAVTDKDVKNQYIPLPPLHIQQKIASILSAVDEKIEKEENKKKALEELFKSMLHNLMTGKVRVKDLDIEIETKLEVDENVGK